MSVTAQQLNEERKKVSLEQYRQETVDLVATRVQQYLERGELHLPPNYSAANALKSAWLVLQETKDKEGRPVLATCTRSSVINALFDMVIQGLNPAKNQCYFIAYGSQLACQRSYFGTMAVAKMVDPSIAEIVAEVVYEGDEFVYRLDRGKKIVVKHEQKLENVRPDRIKAAYAMVIDHNGEVRACEIMTFDQIKQAWRQSPIHPVDDQGRIKAGTTHAKFTAEMCIRTVINKVCKPIINSSDDAQLLRAVKRSEEVAAEVEAEEEIQQNANRQVIDVEPELVDGPEPVPQEQEPEQEPGETTSAPEPEPEPEPVPKLGTVQGTKRKTAADMGQSSLKRMFDDPGF